jgi:hypothetical protein
VINAARLLADLTRLLKRCEDDLRQRIADASEMNTSLQAEWQAARDADRTAETFEIWADQVVTQAGVHWLLSCVFLRFIEDNGLVERPWLSGTPESGRLALARDQHEAYFRERPLESDRDYLLASFREAGALPGLHTFFDEAHNPVFRLGISGDAAMALRQFWQQVDPNTGTLLHDFNDPDWNTRFLGDLYQDLSEATRKRYALLQTPEFVEEFILDRTLTPAIHEFGFREVRMIDPTCGSGHFLLGGFRRLVDEWIQNEPARNPRDIAQRALDAIAGVDINPFAVAISRFRLLVAALKISGVHRLTEAPNFKLNVAIGDSLLHGKRFGMTSTEGMFEKAEHYVGTGLAHAYASEDLTEVTRILARQYHAVVGNPPYIVVKDSALNASYRQRYASCHRQYSLGAPFTERFFDLALTGNQAPAGFVGLITTNSFMKREFGSKLIEQVLPRLDLTHVIDTSGAYIPGHGTPTVILLGRNRPPISNSVRTVMGVKSEPRAPNDPSQGLVWTAIIRQVDQPGTEGEFVSSVDLPISLFHKHPWSLGGGGAANVKTAIDEAAYARLGDEVDVIGYVCMTRADDIYFVPKHALIARGIAPQQIIENVEGDTIRDWRVVEPNTTLFPYQADSLTPALEVKNSAVHRFLWPFRTGLWLRCEPNGNHRELGLTWWEWSRFQRERFKVPLSIAFAFVATANHFVLDRGGRVFKQSAPVIKLPPGSSEESHFALLGILNSSLACFWLQQMCHNKGRPGAETAGADERYEMRYEFDSTKLALFPLTKGRPSEIARRLDSLARALAGVQPAAILNFATANERPLPTRASLDADRNESFRLRCRMIGVQEELDWHCYRLYGFMQSEAADRLQFQGEVEVALGQRAFEIVLARRMASEGMETTWFERHGSKPTTEIPAHWPEEYRTVVQRRIELIEGDRSIGLLERPEFKRRWYAPKWEVLEQAALRDWLLDRLESDRFWPTIAQITTSNRLADAASDDADFMRVAGLYAGHADFDPAHVVGDLVASEAVPFMPVQRYTASGLRKRVQWEETWALQRREDGGEDVGEIPVPPKYEGKDFLTSDIARQRGPSDVPKERWVSYPGCERGADTSLPIAWAGWNHLQQATALAAYYVEMKDNEGWEPVRLQPLLAGLLELVPWLEQWHNEVDPLYGERMGTYYRGFVNEEARALGVTLEELRAWKPAVASVKRGRKKATRSS